MEANSYPPYNPFPVQATASVDQAERGNLSSAASVQTPQLRQSWQLVSGYLGSRSDPNIESGSVLALYGPAGSGKTHTLRYILASAIRQCNEGQRFLGSVYVLCGTPSVPAIQYGILKGISLDAMRFVSKRFIEIIGLEHIESNPATTDVGREEQAKLRDNLPQIGELIKSALINPEEVSKRQSEELQQGGNEDFKNVISYLDDEKLGEAARSWLCGDPVSPRDLSRLGVSRMERTPDHARDALRVIFRLFQRSVSPLIVFLDQCENLLRSEPNGPLAPDSVQFLQSLAELLPKEQGFLAVAMSHDVWKLLPDYLRQRFGLNTKSFSVLSENDAREFIHTYITGVPPDADIRPSIYPFEEEAIRQVLQSVRGNLRAFLQACYHAFELALPKKESITDTIVCEALKAASIERASLEVVADQINALLRDRGLISEAAVTVPSRASSSITDRNGVQLARLEVSEALFIDDEARQSVKTVDAVRDAVRKNLPVIVVVLGYASPEILGALGQATPHILVYDPGNFSQRFSSIIEDIQHSAPISIQPILPAIETHFSELRTELLRLFESRTQNAERTTGSVSEVADRQEENRIKELWRAGRVNWAKERRGIEEEIKAARFQRGKEELEILEWQRNRAAKERSRSLALMWGGILLAIEGVVIYLLRSDYLYLRRGNEIYTSFGTFLGENTWRVLSPLILVVCALAVQMFGFGGPGRVLWSRVHSIDELNDLAARLIRWRSPRRPELFSNNPQLRYAAARGLPPEDQSSSPLESVLRMYRIVRAIRPRDIRRALEVESNPTVRRGLAWRFGHPEMEEIPFDVQWPERVYRNDSKGIYTVYEGFLSENDLDLIRSVQNDPPLSTAYRRGINEDIWEQMSYNQSVPQIQAVLRRLSPLEKPGLGTFDYLKDIAEVDNLYLFFRQWIYYIELDLPVLPGKFPFLSAT